MSTKRRKVMAIAIDVPPFAPVWELPRTAEDYDAMLAQAAEAIANRNGYTIGKTDGGIHWFDAAHAALKSIGITRPKGGAK